MLSIVNNAHVKNTTQHRAQSSSAHFLKGKFSFSHYIYTLIVLVSIGFNIFLYLTFRSQLELDSSQQPVGRVLPFRGTIKETDGSPLDTKRDAVFNLYSSQTGNSPLYTGSCIGESGIEPTFNGSFTILIGSDCGMKPIPEEIFNSNNTLYLGVKIGSEPELEPRYQIFTSSFSKDTSKLQGLPLGTETSSVPFINESGEIVIENESPTLKSTNGTFTVEGGNITFTSTQEEGNINLDPALGGNVIVTSGRFGVGTFDPQAVFDVAGSSILQSTVNFSNLTTEDNPNASVLKLNLGTAPEGESSEFISFYSGVNGDSQGVKVGNIRINNNAVVYETNGADFAEYFEVTDTSLFKVSQVVALTDKGIVPAQINQNIIGVISNSAGFIGNSKVKDNSILVGMIGQIEVFASTIYGDINMSDIVGASKIPGYAAKGTDVESKVGLSLQNSDDLNFSNEQCPDSYKSLKSTNGTNIRCGVIRVIISLD